MHYSMWPLMWQSACGAENEAKTTELGLVDCEPCKRVVIRAEILGRAS